jgi:hypothetical protein
LLMTISVAATFVVDNYAGLSTALFVPHYQHTWFRRYALLSKPWQWLLSTHENGMLRRSHLNVVVVIIVTASPSEALDAGRQTIVRRQNICYENVSKCHSSVQNVSKGFLRSWRNSHLPSRRATMTYTRSLPDGACSLTDAAHTTTHC